MTEKIALVFGSGKSIEKFKDVIPDLISIYSEKTNPNYTSAGINQFPQKFIDLFSKAKKSLKIDYWAFNDAGLAQYVADNYNGQKLIVNGELDKEELKVFEDKKFKVDVVYTHTDKLDLEDNTELYGMYCTPLKVIHYFLKKGYKVVVFGMDNKCEEDGSWQHFYPEEIPIIKSEDQLMDIKFDINELGKLGKIYKVDPENNLDLPVIDLTELVKGNIVEIAPAPEVEEVEPIKVEVDNKETEEDSKVEETLKDTNEPVVETKDEVKEDKDSKPEEDKDVEQDKDPEEKEPVFITLQVPHMHPEEGTMSYLGEEYEIKDKLLTVKLEHVDNLIKQGFKHA